MWQSLCQGDLTLWNRLIRDKTRSLSQGGRGPTWNRLSKRSLCSRLNLATTQEGTLQARRENVKIEDLTCNASTEDQQRISKVRRG